MPTEAPTAPATAAEPGQRRSFVAQLREQTRADHAAAEASLDLASLHCPADLARLLSGWHAVWADVARAASRPLASAPARSELTVLAEQAVRWLESDLADLGYAPASAADAAWGEIQRERYRELSDLLAVSAASWGVAYVLRGSRLGGTVLAPQIRATLRLRGAVGTTFLASAGTDPGREWRTFRRRLDDASMTSQARVEAVHAARWTFCLVGAVLLDHAHRTPCRRTAGADLVIPSVTSRSSNG